MFIKTEHILCTILGLIIMIKNGNSGHKAVVTLASTSAQIVRHWQQQATKMC